jgi:hypothetical protein
MAEKEVTKVAGLDQNGPIPYETAEYRAKR